MTETLPKDLKVPFWFCSCRHEYVPVYYADELQRRTERLHKLEELLIDCRAYLRSKTWNFGVETKLCKRIKEVLP